MSKAEHVVILVTAKDKSEAKKIARGLLDDKLIACANLVGGVESLFRWNGKIDEASEILLVLKTKRSLFKKIASKVKALHSYDTPEVIALPVIEGSEDYLKWINASVKT